MTTEKKATREKRKRDGENVAIRWLDDAALNLLPWCRWVVFSGLLDVVNV